MDSLTQERKALKILWYCPRRLQPILKRSLKHSFCKGLAKRAGLQPQLEKCQLDNFEQQLAESDAAIGIKIQCDGNPPEHGRRRMGVHMTAAIYRNTSLEPKLLITSLKDKVQLVYSFHPNWRDGAEPILDDSICFDPSALEDSAEFFFPRYFSAINELAHKLNEDLVLLIEQLSQPSIALPMVMPKDSEETRIKPLWRKEVACEIGVLVFEVEALKVAEAGDNPLEVERRFHQAIAPLLKGRILSGCQSCFVYVYQGPDFRKKLLLAGIQIHKQAGLFNLEFPESGINLKAAASSGSFLPRTDKALPTELIEETIDLMHQAGHAATLVISDLLLQNADQGLAAQFRTCGHHRANPIYIYTEERERLPLERLSELKHELRTRCDRIHHILTARLDPDPTHMARLKGDFHELYLCLESLCGRWLSKVDPRWGPTYLKQVLELVCLFQDEEGQVWQKLMVTLPYYHAGQTGRNEYAYLVKNISSLRAAPTVQLDQLITELCSAMGTQGPETVTRIRTLRDLRSTLDAILDSDPLEVERQIYNLRTITDPRLKDLISGNVKYARLPELTDLLWANVEVIP